MNENNTFSIDVDSEKAAFSEMLNANIQTQNDYKVNFEPKSFDRITLGQIQELERNPQQIEPMRSMVGVVNTYSYSSKPISMAESAQRDITQLNLGSDTQLHKTMNTMSQQMQSINNKLNSKQDIRSNEKTATEERPTNTPKNLMFADRLARASQRPSWG
jgi:hypothetical protein